MTDVAAKATPARVLVNAARVAKLLNLDSERRVQQLVKDEGMPRADHGLYDAERCVLWYVRYLQRCIQRRQGETAPAAGNAQLRIKLAEAAMAEFKLAQLQGEFVRKADYRAELERLLGKIDGVLELAPGKYGPVLPGDAPIADKVAALRAIVREVRGELRAAGAPEPPEPIANAAVLSADPSADVTPDPATSGDAA